MKKIKLFCSFIILCGIGLFAATYFLIPSQTPIYAWCLGLACALIILGCGYLINIFIHTTEGATTSTSLANRPEKDLAKEKAGYLVCKIMNILLCIYIVIIEELGVNPIVLILSIVLLVMQYLLNLFLYLFLFGTNGN